MKKLYDKNEVTFAVIMIVIYVVGMSIMKDISEKLGIEYFAECFFAVILAAIIMLFIRKNGLGRYYGLCAPNTNAKDMLYYIPLFSIPVIPIFFGIGTNHSTAVIITHTISMLFVGLLEEVIFRGFLFRGIEKSSRKRAVIITALTFGFGHIANLINGYEIFDNIIQIIYAVAVGFMLVIIVIKTGSLISCIIFHSLNNMLADFCTGERLITFTGSEKTAEIVMLAVRLLIVLAYTLYVSGKVPDET